MIWYILLFAFVLVSMLIMERYKGTNLEKGMEILVLIVLILFSGTRYHLGGYDYDIYEDIFRNAPYLNQFTFQTTNLYGTEIGYLFINSFIKTLGFNFYGFTLIHSIFFYVMFYIALKRYKLNFGYILIIFLYKLFIFNTFVSLRQSIVLVLFFFSLKYIFEKKWFSYYAIIFPCCFIHSSALFLLPLYFIGKIKFTKKSLILYSLIFFLLFLLNIMGIYVFNPINLLQQLFANSSIMLEKVDQYFTDIVSVNILNVLECYGIIFLLILNFDEIYQNKEQKLFIHLFLLLIPIVTFFRSFEIMIRLRDYFAIFMAFVLSYIYKLYPEKDKQLFYLITILFCFAGYIRYIYNYDGGSLRDYQSYIIEKVNIREE